MNKVVLIVFLILSAAPLFAGSSPEAAGVQVVGDYKRVETGDIWLEWRIDGDRLDFRMSGPTTGWIAVGFDPVRAMQGANIVLVSVVNGEVSARDDYGVGMFVHAPDVERGGTNDVAVIGGSESAGRTAVELSIPLDSGDEYDSPLAAGETHKIIWAYGQNNDDEFRRKHVARGSFEVEL